MNCDFQLSGESHGKTGLPKWVCSSCGKHCWGDSPANSKCRSESAATATTKRVLMAGLPCEYRGETRSAGGCCGSWVQVATCSKLNMNCTLKGVVVDEQQTARCIGCQLRKA